MDVFAALVEHVAIEREDGVNYVAFAFPVVPDRDPDGLQFQWADDEASPERVYLELGGQANGGYGQATAIRREAGTVVVALKAGSVLPFREVRLDCSGLDASAVREAVAKVATVLAA